MNAAVMVTKKMQKYKNDSSKPIAEQYFTVIVFTPCESRYKKIWTNVKKKLMYLHQYNKISYQYQLCCYTSV